ncbi:hypothetical protein ECC02_011404 [Trypanosoma cruzi]|uniref:Mucin TcMUCII n=1 Tax=Trypanosoma cruzi TaxID=5693 RepID=A0A7J6XMV5_TRYCR|nr:hypothetical protein ECC02_011404 [Trypanosoma cruzi]
MINIGCTSRGPTIHVECEDLLFFYCYFAFVLLCALHVLLCVCVPSVRGADTTDRSRRMCMRWSLVCRSCLLLPLPSVCWCCGRAVCVCVCLLPWIGVCVVRGVRRTVHAWLPPSPHVVCPLCVCLPHLSSPLLLSISLTVQISSTPLNDHTMMTTCRLLCALLVLALCCCPFLCVTATGTAKELNKADASAPSPPSNPPATTTGESGLQDVVSAAEPQDVDGDVRGTSGSETQSDGATDKSQKHDNNDTTGPQGSTNRSADQTDQNGEDPAATTTTTTTAPVAPSTTTTTEAPTTTTTRAPSRLREIDGSLSSSAWVCAPLLLAASALAYTTVG